jgi:raffinose/stachyose/melibiose transport system permease protein
MRLKESGGVSSWLMLSPSLIFLAVCSIWPFIWIFRYIGYNYNGFTAQYIGVGKNITRMFNDSTFWASVGTTFEYALWKIVLIIPFALIMAVLLNQKLRGSSFFRGAYFMPTVIATSISGMIFTFIFATNNGILNSLFQALHLMGPTPINWLNDQHYAMVAVMTLSVWAGFGNYMLYFVTGMTSISEDVYESSRIDGANGVQTFFKITLPMLSPVLKVVLMLAITGAFKDYEAIMVLTDGGPGGRTNVMFLYIYKLIFGTASNARMQIGYGALLSLMAAVIVGAVTVIYNLVAKKLDDVV